MEFKAVKRKQQFSFVTPVTEEDIKELQSKYYLCRYSR